MNSEENKNLIVMIVVLVIVGILSLVYNFIIKEKEELKKEEVKEEIILVSDYNRFFTISSCVSKYINYLSADSKENILFVLSENFKTLNNINEENIYTYVNKIEGNKVFAARKMYEEKIGENIFKYYVYGNLQNDTLNEISEREEYYVIVIIDENNMTFAIEPYNGKLFDGSDVN